MRNDYITAAGLCTAANDDEPPPDPHALPWPDAAFVVLMPAVAAWAVVGTTVGWIIQTLRSVS